MLDWLTDGIAGLFGGGIDAAVSAKIAADNRKFQERMTRHRYRYQMEDMRLAGLNPMLAAGASPPSSPPGAMPSMQSPATSGIAAASALAQQRLAKEQARKVGNEADITGIQAYVAALGLDGIEGAEDIVKDLVRKHAQDFKSSAAEAWRNNTRTPTVPEVFPHGAPGPPKNWENWRPFRFQRNSARGN